MSAVTTGDRYAREAPRYGGRSPWGKIQHVQRVADGVWIVSTPGHGGIKLCRALNRKMGRAALPGGWYEEDCAAALPIVAFPELFQPNQHAPAVQSAKEWFPDEYEALTGVRPFLRESRRLRERDYRERHRGKLFLVSAFSSSLSYLPKPIPAGHVVVCATVDGSRERGTREHWFLLTEDLYRSWKTDHGWMVIDPDQSQPWDWNPVAADGSVKS